MFQGVSFHLKTLAPGTTFSTLSKLAGCQFPPDVSIPEVYSLALQAAHEDIRRRIVVLITCLHAYEGDYDRGVMSNIGEIRKAIWICRTSNEKFSEKMRVYEKELTPFHAIPMNLECVLVSID
jgi:hypothetical protein